MAGFDFNVPYSDSDLLLTRALLAKLQRICRSYDLEMRYRRVHENSQQFYVTVDGSLPMMQALVPTLVTALPSYAEGAPSPPDRLQRIRRAKRIGRLYWKGVLYMTDTIQGVADYLGGTPNSFLFDIRERNEEIDDRLWSLSSTLIAYENGVIQPAQMLEEIHTALEWVMQASIGPSARRMTYASMAESLRDSGVISAEHAAGIIQMKDLRVGAKHRRQAVSREQVNDHLHLCIEALHKLLRESVSP